METLYQSKYAKNNQELMNRIKQNHERKSIKQTQNLTFKHNDEMKTLNVVLPQGLMKNKNLSPEMLVLKNQIDQMNKTDPINARKTIAKLALDHVMDQRKQGNFDETPDGPVRGKNFVPHALPEVNAVIYGFEYKKSQLTSVTM